MSNEMLNFRGVTHCFGQLAALSRTSLTVHEGDTYGFLGLNGAGKTTAVRLAVGLLRLRTGEIRLFGHPVRPRPDSLFRGVGVLFEDFGAPGYLTGGEYAELRARLQGLSRREAREQSHRWMERLGLADKISVKCRKYSLGMRRRLGLACALTGSPRLVILDEPTNGLDPEGIADLRNLIGSLNRRDGVTFFLSSHILGEVEQLCNRIGIIHRGRILLEGLLRDLIADTESLRRMRASPGAKAEERIRELPWCSLAEDAREAARAAGEDTTSSRTFLVRVDPADVPRLVRELVASGCEIHEIAAVTEDLETVFHRALARQRAEAEAEEVPRGKPEPTPRPTAPRRS